MKINPAQTSGYESINTSKAKANSSAKIDTTDVFKKVDADDGTLMDGLKAAALKKGNFSKEIAAKKKEFAEKAVMEIMLPAKPGSSYSDVARLSDGRVAAVRKYRDVMIERGKPDYTLAFFDNMLNEVAEVPFRAYCIRSTSDGSFLAYGGSDKMAAFTPDGDEKWQTTFEKNKSHYGDSLKTYPDGRMLVTDIYDVMSVDSSGKITHLDKVPDKFRYSRILDEMGNVYDCNLKSKTPHYFRIDERGVKTRVNLPAIPEPGLVDGSVEIDGSPSALTNGSLLVTTKPKYDSTFMPSPHPTYLVNPQTGKTADLLPDGFKKIQGFVQGPDGSIYGIASRSSLFVGVQSQPGTERVLFAYDKDGNKKWEKPLPGMKPGYEDQGLFMDAGNRVFVMTSNIMDTGGYGTNIQFHNSELKAFDADGSELWTKNFDDNFSVDKVETLGSSGINIYQYKNKDSIFHIETGDFTNGNLVKEAAKDMAENGGKQAAGIVVDKDKGTVSIGGVKLPLNRSFSFIR